MSEKTETGLKSLSRAQLDQFHKKGFVAVGPLLEEGEVRELAEEYDRLFAEARQTARMRNLSSSDGEATTAADEEMLQIVQMCERSILYRRLLYDDRPPRHCRRPDRPQPAAVSRPGPVQAAAPRRPHPLAPGQRLLEVSAGEPRQLLADPRRRGRPQRRHAPDPRIPPAAGTARARGGDAAVRPRRPGRRGAGRGGGAARRRGDVPPLPDPAPHPAQTTPAGSAAPSPSTT